MDFRAVKIILVTFLVIAFITPFLRLSVAMPKKGKEEIATYTQPVSRDAVRVEPASIALSGKDATSQLHVAQVFGCE